MKNSIVVASRGRNTDNPSDRKTKSNGTFVQKLEPLGGGGKTNTLSTVDKDNWILIYEELCHPGECFDAENPNSETRRGRKMTDKSNCLMAQNDTNFMKYEGPRIINLFGKKVRVLGIRRLTPTESARLQTIPTWYKWECFETKEEIKEGEICSNVKLKDVCSLLQAERLGYATSTICDLLGQEQQNSEESLLTQLKSVSWMAVTTEGEPLKVSASSITKNGNESNQPTQQKNALFVESRSDAPDATECVVSITLHGSDMETLYIPTNVNTNLMEILGQNTTKLTESSFIGLLQKKYSEDRSEKTRLFITSTLINWIIARTIFTSAQTKNICVCIGNSSEWQQHSLKTDLLYLRTGIIKKTSDSSCYRMLGNGWTVEVIKHIFSFLPEAWKA